MAHPSGYSGVLFNHYCIRHQCGAGPAEHFRQCSDCRYRYRCGVQRNFHRCFHCCAGVRHYRYGQGGKGTGSQYALAEQAG